MYKTLRIIFTIISAIFAGIALPIGYFLDGALALPCAILSGLIALVFFGLMLICKKNQEMEERNDPQAPDIPYPSPKDDNKAE